MILVPTKPIDICMSKKKKRRERKTNKQGSSVSHTTGVDEK
jgi:hypothetical protein